MPYLQRALEITDQAVLASFAQRHPFATFISSCEAEVEVSHIPLQCDVDPPRIRGHVARVNPQASHLERGCALTMVFRGAHRYVSPDATPPAPLLPTWNYAAVHARGRARVLSDQETRALLEDLVGRLEQKRDQPWRMASAEELVNQLFPLIVGFEVEELAFESRLKITRDRDLQSPQAALRALQGTADPVEREVLALLTLQARRAAAERRR